MGRKVAIAREKLRRIVVGVEVQTCFTGPTRGHITTWTEALWMEVSKEVNIAHAFACIVSDGRHSRRRGSMIGTSSRTAYGVLALKPRTTRVTERASTMGRSGRLLPT